MIWHFKCCGFAPLSRMAGEGRGRGPAAHELQLRTRHHRRHAGIAFETSLLTGGWPHR